jgi:hypothetical protein
LFHAIDFSNGARNGAKFLSNYLKSPINVDMYRSGIERGIESKIERALCGFQKVHRLPSQKMVCLNDHWLDILRSNDATKLAVCMPIAARSEMRSFLGFLAIWLRETKIPPRLTRTPFDASTFPCSGKLSFLIWLSNLISDSLAAKFSAAVTGSSSDHSLMSSDLVGLGTDDDFLCNWLSDDMEEFSTS